ncbi:toxic anion resistance protein [Photobacterium sp. 1_MG-2023]|uniref:toxic anion resistance protein n=1 Tax=Photobacterium sp. 1_MG-2023 TaxID=3062646 RepID=UPI0026E2A817|nr:toxic anion resistance protein [Photobacterium sp. 1_MG-2023]MDO6708383.1 toxic anion resistance protein [Photobacterium sp. 1_MG-2023]
MVKTFHSAVQTSKENKPKIKDFASVEREKPKEISTPVAAPQPEKPHRSPGVLFSHQVKSVNGEVDIPADWKHQVDAEKQPDVELSSNDYLKVRTYSEEINLESATAQIEFCNHLSQQFQEIQGELSDYAKLGKVDQLTDMGSSVIDIAKSIDISIFNPRKVTSKIATLMRTKKGKIEFVKHEFDFACDQIDAKIDSVFQDLTSMKSTLTDFEVRMASVQSIYQELELRVLAAKVRLTVFREEISQAQSSQSASDPFAADKVSSKKEALSRWERKITNLQVLRQSLLMTLPQLKLYSSNLVNGFSRLEEIRTHIIQVWKQQFLTAIALHEKSEVSLYYELNDVQEKLFTSIMELNKNDV